MFPVIVKLVLLLISLDDAFCGVCVLFDVFFNTVLQNKFS